MIGVLQSARRLAGAAVSYRMTYRWNEFDRDDLGDIIDTDPERTKTIYGRVRIARHEPGDGGAVPTRAYQLVINARCGFEPKSGARVTPSCGPFMGWCFTLGGDAMLDAQGANWTIGATHG